MAEITTQSRINIETLASQLETRMKEGNLPTAGEIEGWIEEKATASKHKTRLAVRKSPDDLTFASYFNYISCFAGKKDKTPAYGNIERDAYLSKVWRTEPILAGAVYSMSAKMVSLKWQVTGRRNLAIHFANLFSGAAYGVNSYGWGGFNSSSAQDFYTMDRGTFWEVARRGSPMFGRMDDLGYIDALQCTLTGNRYRPVHYLSEVTGQSIRFRPGEYIHFTSMPTGREEYLGIGFCATSRALKAARLLIGLHKYDEEKLANLPPEGVAAITGLTLDEFTDAMTIWKAAREKDNSLTFPQVLWLIGSQPNVQVKIDFVGFSEIPESFERKVVINQYVNTLALCFGVDAREFWPVSSGALGTAAETEVQHMKARGKGPGEYITTTERKINGELPDGVEFRYDTQDIEEDIQAAEVAKAWVEAYLPLAEIDLLDRDQFMRLLADKGVIPDWMVTDDRVIADDMGVEEKRLHQFSNDAVVTIEWNRGVLKQVLGKPITLEYEITGVKPGSYVEAEILKGGPGSGHHGHAGRLGKRGGSLPGAGGGKQIAMALKRMMPYSNRSKLNIPESGLPDARTKFGDEIDTISYNPDTGTLVAGGGGELHADLIAEHSETMRYDRYVKVVYNPHVSPSALTIDLSRVTTENAEEAWNMGFDTAWALGQVGFSDDVIVKLRTPDNKVRELVLGEMKEYYKEYYYIDGRKKSALRVYSEIQEDAATEFLKQDNGNEPERNIRGQPIPEEEALSGASITKTAIRHEIELWKAHPLLSQYLPHEEPTGA